MRRSRQRQRGDGAPLHRGRNVQVGNYKSRSSSTSWLYKITLVINELAAAAQIPRV